jgi:hypothetical protein
MSSISNLTFGGTLVTHQLKSLKRSDAEDVQCWLRSTKVVSEDLTFCQYAGVSHESGVQEGSILQPMDINLLREVSDQDHFIERPTMMRFLQLPIDIAHIPVPVPRSRIRCVYGLIGAKCNLLSHLNVII